MVNQTSSFMISVLRHIIEVGQGTIETHIKGHVITEDVKAGFRRKSDVRVGINVVTPGGTILGLPLAWLALEDNTWQVNSGDWKAQAAPPSIYLVMCSLFQSANVSARSCWAHEGCEN